MDVDRPRHPVYIWSGLRVDRGHDLHPSAHRFAASRLAGSGAASALARRGALLLGQPSGKEMAELATGSRLLHRYGVTGLGPADAQSSMKPGPRAAHMSRVDVVEEPGAPYLR